MVIRYSTPLRYVFGVEPESEENEEDEIRRVLSACDDSCKNSILSMRQNVSRKDSLHRS